jgi:hypothetical protein
MTKTDLPGSPTTSVRRTASWFVVLAVLAAGLVLFALYGRSVVPVFAGSGA